MSWVVFGKKGGKDGKVYVRRSSKSAVYLSAAAVEAIGSPEAVVALGGMGRARIQPATEAEPHSRTLSDGGGKGSTRARVFGCQQLAELLPDGRIACDVVDSGLEFPVEPGRPKR